MNGAPWGALLIRPILVIAAVFLIGGFGMGQCARLPDPPAAQEPTNDR